MIKRNTWIMISVFGLLLLLSYMLQQSGKEAVSVEESPTQSQAMLVINVPLDSIEELRIAHFDGRSVLLVKTGEAWAMVEPQADAGLVDQGQVEGLLAQLITMRTLTQGGINAPLSALQLEDAPHILTLSTVSGETISLKIGDSSPIGNGYYVALEDEVPLLVAKNPIDQAISFLDVPPLLPTTVPLDENLAP